MNRTALSCTCVASAALLCHGILTAGPLTPPAGPVTSSYKTLSEVEPRTPISAANTPGSAASVFIISQPGSYYLPANLDGAPGKNVIEITASNVALDLMGFRILGNGSTDGIHVTGAQSNITIKNGSVRTCGGDGIDAASAATLRLADIIARNNTGVGLLLGSEASITNCIAQSNSGDGIRTGLNSALSACIARDNGGDGIDASSGSTLDHCTSNSNTLSGFNLDSAVTATSCSAYQNAGDGFYALNGGAIRACTSRLNTGRGIRVSVAATVSGCTVSENTSHGIEAGSRSVVEDNNVSCTNTAASVSCIQLLGDAGRAEHNHIVNESPTGSALVASGVRNVVVRNTVLGSSVLWVPGTNYSGLWESLSPGSSFTTDRPWDNFFELH